MRVKVQRPAQASPVLKRVKVLSSVGAVPTADVLPPMPALSSKPLVNAYWTNDTVVLVHPDRTVSRAAAKFVAYAKAAEVGDEVMRQLKGNRRVKSLLREADWLRIECVDLYGRAEICYYLEERCKVQTYEGDINPMRRYMVDHEPAIAPPRHCYFDLETDSRVPFTRKEETRILCVSVVDGIDWDKPDLPHARRRYILEEDTDAAELHLLKLLWATLLEYQQCIAWSGKRFDFEVLKARTKYHGLQIPWKRWLWLDHLELFRRMNMSAAESGEEKQSMKLNTIAMTVCGEGKDDFDSSKTWEAWEAGGAERERLADYCDQDTILMPKIEAATGYIALLGTLCEVTGTFPDTLGISPQQQVESFMLTLAKRQNYKPHTRASSYEFVKHARAKAADASYEPEEHFAPAQFQGAFVMQPKTKGIMRDVHVCDFAAMYPSIILTWNMSPETKIGKASDPNASRPVYLGVVPYDPVAICMQQPDRAIADGTNVMFSQAKLGILPIAIAELIRLRKYWNEKKAACAPGTPEWKEADRRSMAYKIAGNSFYGVMGSPSSRFFDREVAESVTLSGVWLIKETIAEAERRGMTCIYGDTDSAFITGVSKAEFEAFVEHCNKVLYPAMIAGRGCQRNAVKLAYEKEFGRLVMTSAKKYCNPPEAPVWMGDLTHKPMGEVQVGDEVIGWAVGSRATNRRRLLVSKVVAVHKHMAPVVKVTMASGRTIRCTPDHSWLRMRELRSKRGEHSYSYPWTKSKVGGRLVRALDPSAPMTREQEIEAAWLGGIYDGEGSLSGGGGGGRAYDSRAARQQIVISQSPVKNPEVCARIERALALLGIPYSVWPQVGNMNVYAIRGQLQAKVDFVVRCRPAKSPRLVPAALKARFAIEERIVSIEPDGESEVIGLTTTTGNYFAWGFASKNCGNYKHYKGTLATADSKPEVRGLEYKRGDASRLAREMQHEAIDLLMRQCCDDPAAYHALTIKHRDKIMQHPFTLEEVQISKRLSQSLNRYAVRLKKDGTASAQQPHVMIGKILAKRGRDVGEGQKIDYVCVDGSTSPKQYIPAEDFTGEFDRHEMWEALVYPPTQRLLEAAFPKAGWEAYERTRPAKSRARRDTASLDLFEHAASRQKKT